MTPSPQGNGSSATGRLDPSTLEPWRQTTHSQAASDRAWPGPGQRRPTAQLQGFAVSVRAEPRFTRDIDLVVAVEDDQTAESLVRLLVDAGHRLIANVDQAGRTPDLVEAAGSR